MVKQKLESLWEGDEGESGDQIPKTFLNSYYDPFEEKPTFSFSNLDEAQEAAAECVTETRGSQWRLADLVAVAVDKFGKYGIYKKLAGVVFYTARRLKQFEVLGRTFGPGTRYPDQPLLLYETALKAEDPMEALEKALDEEWSPRELKDWIGGKKGEKVSRVKLFGGEAPLIAQGETWRIAVEAGQEWPEGDGVYTCYVTVKRIIEV